MALVATSLKVAFTDVSRALQFSFMLFLAALFAIVGGYFMGGQTILSYDWGVPTVLVSLLELLLFSYIFVWFASDVSEFLGHRTYLSREAFALRGFRVFLIWLVVYVTSALAFLYVPYPLDALVVFIFSITAVYTSLAVAVDGHSISAAVSQALSVMSDQWYHVLEFLVLTFLIMLPVFLIDVFGGYAGSLIAVLLVTFVVLPWTVTHAVLTYLYRYPIVVAALSRLERF